MRAKGGTRFVALLLLLAASAASAAHPGDKFRDYDAGVLPDGGSAIDRTFAYLDGIGAEKRGWEVMSETAFGEAQVLTERLEVALAVKIPRFQLNVVGRVGLGFDAAVDVGTYAVQGATFAVGVRHISDFRNFLVEAGFRVVPAWQTQRDNLPNAQTLALAATLTSGAADDARWLPIASTGLQAYVEFQARTRKLEWPDVTTLAFGARYGGIASLMPISVHTWLGPEPQFLANIFLELFMGVATVRHWNVRLLVGGHVDLSLSSIWPGDLPFPLVANGFFGWSPTDWFMLRLFAGWGGSIGAPATGKLQYGARLVFYFP